MKLSKKILGAVLCGLIVVGGSNANLVKANAQEQWREGVRLQTHAKGMPAFTDYWGLDFVLENGALRLDGRTNIPLTITFNDEFHIGWKKGYEQYICSPIVFRGCWQANAGDALRRVKAIFNGAHLGVGDEIFIYGEDSNDSVKFCNPTLIREQKSRISYNTYDEFYKRHDKHHTLLRVENDGLEVVSDSRYF